MHNFVRLGLFDNQIFANGIICQRELLFNLHGRNEMKTFWCDNFVEQSLTCW